MEKIMLLVKGFIIGAANIVPGVSGGTIMVSLNVFEDLIYAANHFFEDKKKNIKFLLNIAIGIVLALLIMSFVITYCLENHQVPTIILFIAIIMGGLPSIFKHVEKESYKLSYFIAFLIPFISIICMSLTTETTNIVLFNDMNILSYIKLFLMGILSASAMIVPGLSGSFMLMLFGYYESILTAIKEFLTFNDMISNFFILLSFGVGIIIGLLIIIRLIEYLLKNFKHITYFAIIGFIIASIISIIITNFSIGTVITSGILFQSIILFIIGFIASYRLGE